MEWKINNTVIFLRMGKNLKAKTSPGDFQVTTLETSLLSQQAVTSKGIPSTLPTYSWILTPIPHWTCSVVTVPLSDVRLPSTWLTIARIPVRDFKTPTEKIVSCKVLQFIHTMKIKKMLGHKTLRCKYTATSSRERDELGQEPYLWSQFAWTEFAQYLCNLCIVLQLLKQSFFMSRVRRKKGPKTYSRIPRKSDLNYEILKPRQIGGVEMLSTSCWALMNLHSLLDFLNRLEVFNTWSWNVVSWSI